MESLTDPLACAEAVVNRVGRTIVLAVPIGIGKPVRLLNALYGLALADKSITLRIFTGLTLVRPRYKSDLERRFVAPLLDRLFPTWPDIAYAEAQRSGHLPANIHVHEFFMQAGQWINNPAAQQNYASLNYRHVAAHLQRLGTNVLAQAIAPHPDGRARVSLSSNTDITLDMHDYVATRRAAGQPVVVVGELNENLPYMPGEAEVEISEFDMLLSPSRPHYDLFAPPKEPVSLTDYAAAIHVAPWIRDGGTLQIGIGSFADALCHVLLLRHTRNAEFRDLVARLGNPLSCEADLMPFTKGLYGCSEMLVDGFLALEKAGVLKRNVAPHIEQASPVPEPVLHAGFFVGNNSFYRTLRELAKQQRARFAMTAISFTNGLLGDTQRKISDRRDARFVNTALAATLLGAVAADQLEDGRVVSGVGGQCDFLEMAHDLPGARALTAVRATRLSGRGRRQSNIVGHHAATTIPRQFRDIIVTEYGAADLRGRTDAEVAGAMIAIADKEFAGKLRDEAVAARKLPASYAMPERVSYNTAARITEALGPARSSGLLPKFPLGSDMTTVEESLLPGLAHLREANWTELVATAVAGMSEPLRADEEPLVGRMDLSTPTTWHERAMRILILGAIRRAQPD